MRENDDDSVGTLSLLCEEVAELIAILNDQPIQVDVDLTAMVDEVFFKWVGAGAITGVKPEVLPPKKKGKRNTIGKRARDTKLSVISEKSKTGLRRSVATRASETANEEASEGSFEEEDILGFDLGKDIDSLPDDVALIGERIRVPPLSKMAKQRLKSVATVVIGASKKKKKKSYHCINGCGRQFNSWSRFIEHVRATGHML